MEKRECGSCKWNDDGLCDRKGIFVEDTDHACQFWTHSENKGAEEGDD